MNRPYRTIEAPAESREVSSCGWCRWYVGAACRSEDAIDEAVQAARRSGELGAVELARDGVLPPVRNTGRCVGYEPDALTVLLRVVGARPPEFYLRRQESEAR